MIRHPHSFNDLKIIVRGLSNSTPVFPVSSRRLTGLIGNKIALLKKLDYLDLL
jgi:hypothetical protein